MVYYYTYQGKKYAALESLALLACGEPREGEDVTFLINRSPENRRTGFLVTDPRQLTAKADGVEWLDSRRIDAPVPDLPKGIVRRLKAGELQAVNFRHPRWEKAADRTEKRQRNRRRVHLLAVGDVGGTLLTALKLLGGDCIGTIGICDLNENTVARWVSEMSQISWPWDYEALPKVEAVQPGHLFDCDVFLFAAAKAIPPVGSQVQDVRMAQFAANRPLVESFARQAREARFDGLFAVLSDPVDPLCKAAYLASNTSPDGQWDGMGLLAEQVQGYGLGVMNARAAALAQSDLRFLSFLSDGRSFGPHGEGLVIANSLKKYDDEISRELTELVKTANLRIRDLGFKPFVAPAVSSGAMQLLLTLRGQWHCGSVCLGGVWFGVRNRLTPKGLETESMELPDALFARLKETETTLKAIL
ncbi:lactate dehydrogenase [Oscillibacter sp.]|uniref:lactate dehydrogenase n=1 Tax=Oscillibacter sp. TaxID=1945593 RepID=UPI00289CC6FC|nr:lactate dehydrogenase [Oscillibacter sp.]